MAFNLVNMQNHNLNRWAWVAFWSCLLLPNISWAGGGFVDLSPVDISAQVTQHTIQFTVQVENKGTAASGGFALELFVGTLDAPTMGDHGYPYVWVEDVGPGETASVVCPLVSLPSGSYPTWVLIDSYNTVPETDETNNVLGPYGAAIPPATTTSLPDLFVTGVDVLPQPDGSLKYSVHTYNGGGPVTDDSLLQIFYSYDEQPSLGIPNAVDYPGSNFGFTQSNSGWLGTGGTKTVNFYWPTNPTQTPPSVGVHKTWVIVDALVQVIESDEINNIYGPFVVDLTETQPLPDLSISDVRAEVNGYSVTYEVDVYNGGSSPPAPFDIDVFPQVDGQPDIASGMDYDVVSSAVSEGPAPGETKTYTVIWNDGVAGDYTSWAGVDAYQHLTETNETNNFWGPVPITIIEVAGADIGIDGFDVEVIGGNAIFTVQLSNDGDLDTGSFEAHLFYHRDSAPEMGVAGDLSKSVENLTALGGTAELTLQWTAVPQGEHMSWLVVDPMNKVSETKEGNNIAGPVDIVIDEAVCPMDSFLSSMCSCGGVSVQSGYCCNGAWSALPCDVISVDPDAGSSAEDAGEDDTEEGDIDEKDIVTGDDSTPAKDDGGCRSGGGSPLAPPIAVLALTALVILGRSRRHP